MRRYHKVPILALIGVTVIWHGLMESRTTSRSALAQTPTSSELAVPVTVGRVEMRDVPVYLSGIGSVQPLNQVTIKVRVDGQLDQAAFVEGQEVHTGDVLAQIDPRSYQAQLKLVEANKAKDEAQLNNARLDLARLTTLEARGAATQQSVDTAKAQTVELGAAVAADQAAVDMAKLQLDFTTIKAPIDGRAGLRLVDPGSIVHASDPGGLVTITQMAPIAAIFALSQDDLPEILRAMAGGSVEVAAYSRDGEHLLAIGKLVFVDSQVDQATGQVKLKAQFNNADRILWPGEFVSARVQVRSIKNAITVPANAIEQGQTGSYVYRVKPDASVEMVPVTIQLVSGPLAIISKGLAPNDEVVVDGQYRLKPGAHIESRPVSAGSPL
jgi:membrane fusion protein, multidrug efflux system